MITRVMVKQGDYEFYCGGYEHNGTYSVSITRKGKLVKHEEWTEAPTYEKAREVLNGYSRDREGD